MNVETQLALIGIGTLYLILSQRELLDRIHRDSNRGRRTAPIHVPVDDARERNMKQFALFAEQQTPHADGSIRTTSGRGSKLV